MRLILLLLLVVAIVPVSYSQPDDDFSEFDEPDLHPIKTPKEQPAPSPSVYQDESTTSNEREDSDEDIGLDGDPNSLFEDIADKESSPVDGETKEGEPLRFTRVPVHLRNNWDAYYMEILMGMGILVYFINFIIGRNQNESLANAWLDVHRDILETNFSLVGDDGKKEIEHHGLMKESESVYLLWCSGRICVEGMLVELRLWKRHDLLSVLSKMMKPVNDQVIVRINLDKEVMDNYVFCLATKKTSLRLVKDMNDLSVFCPERKATDKLGLTSDKFVMMNEIGEVASGLMDTKVIQLINKFSDSIDYIHISDQFSGPKPSELDATPMKLPETDRVMIFSFNLSSNKSGSSALKMEEEKPLMQMVFYLLDRVKRLRLSKESRVKSEKNRQKVEESFLKATHAQRQEAAQLKREEKKRAEKEKILNENDPDKQRKLEEKEYKREMKKKAGRVKQMRVKAM